MLEQLLHIDGQILLWIQEYLRFPALTSVMKDITNLGNAGNLMDSDHHCAFAGQEDEKRRLYVGTGTNWFVNCRQYFT